MLVALQTVFTPETMVYSNLTRICDASSKQIYNGQAHVIHVINKGILSVQTRLNSSPDWEMFKIFTSTARPNLHSPYILATALSFYSKWVCSSRATSRWLKIDFGFYLSNQIWDSCQELLRTSQFLLRLHPSKGSCVAETQITPPPAASLVTPLSGTTCWLLTV